MRLIAIPALCLLLALCIATGAGAKIRITKINYNPPGADTGSNKSLKAEWIAVRNKGTRAKQLLGWKIRDREGHVYRIGDFKLPGRTTFKLHTGSGLDSFPSDLYWGLSNYVWNNDGDKALEEQGRRRCRQMLIFGRWLVSQLLMR